MRHLHSDALRSGIAARGLAIMIVAVVIVAPATGAAAGTKIGQAQPAGASCRNGLIEKTPSPGSRGELYDNLFDIAAINSDNVWADGYYIKAPNTVNLWQTLIEHYSGGKWRVVPSPDPTPNDVLYSITAISPTDLWAVGVAADKSRQHDHTLTEHWNGSAWSVVPSPGTGLLDTVAGSSPDDVWAGGFRDVDNGAKPIENLIEHWDGTSWKTVASPEPGAYSNGTASISVVTPNDVWAVGQANLTAYHFEPTAEHWNGMDWTATILPGKGQDSALSDISSAGSDDLWAAGSYYKSNPRVGELTFTLTEHWNGQHWSIVSTPSPGGDSLLKGVAAVSESDAWAVGSSGAGDAGLILHWNGKDWTQVDESYEQHATTLLFSVSAPAAHDIWTSGVVAGLDTGGYRTFAEYTCSTNG